MVKEHFYKGTLCLMEQNITQPLMDILSKEGLGMIVEFGTYIGGFTKRLVDNFPTIPIYTFDVVELVTLADLDYLRQHGQVTRVLTNLFKQDSMIVHLLSLPVKKFLLVDNGNKKEEFFMYASMLRPGDLMAIHDWPSEVNLTKEELRGFEAHPINEEWAVPGVSEMRLFRRVGPSIHWAIPGDYKGGK